MLRRQARLLSIPLLLITPLAGHAEEKDDSELAALLAMLEHQTEIATKTGLNKDYVPGLVTVLDGRDLEKRGIRNLADALRLVPGLDVLRDETGSAQVLVRGLANTYAASNVKLMLNGVALNSASLSGAAFLYEMPIAQVDRVEVIRGPGSAIHGEFALMGVVNVRTRDVDTRGSVEIDNQERVTVGGNHHWTTPDGRWNFALNAAFVSSPGGEIDAGPDALVDAGFPQFSYAPGEANSKRRYGSLLFSADSGEYRFSAQLIQDAAGDYFGINHYLPPEQRLVTTTTFYSLEAERRFRLDEGHRADLRAGWRRHDLETDERFIGRIEVWRFPYGGPEGPDRVADVDLVEDRGYLEIDYLMDNDNHDLLFNAGVGYAEISDSRQALNLDPVTFEPSAEKNAFPPPVEDGSTRWNYFLTLQDEWRVNDKLSLTAGARYDYYDDSGDALSPRLAAVYRLNRDTTLKAQYARAFRPPTLLEVGGQVDEISPVYSDTVEAALIIGQAGNRAALTLFHNDVRDLIVFDYDELGFDNIAEARTTGAELEWERQFNRFFTLDGNVSYARARDRTNGGDMADSARWLGTLGLRVTPRHDLDLHLQVSSDGDRARAPDDRRAAMPGATTADLTLSWRTWADLTLRTGIRNLGDAELRYPSPDFTYRDDLPRAGRTFWIGMVYEPKQ